MSKLYDEAKEWVRDNWKKDNSFNTRIRIIGSVLLIELIDLLHEAKFSLKVTEKDLESKPEK